MTNEEAIEVLNSNYPDSCFELLREAVDLSIKALKDAQPEIVRCKDCKHRDPEDKKCDCGHDILWQLPRRDDWFCADAERRTGEQTD